MPVYIIRAGDTDKVKIGWAEDPENRRRALQTAHWEPLRVIRLIGGVPATELWMHQRFAGQQIRNEWHYFHSDMMTIEPPSLIPASDSHAAIIASIGGIRSLAEAMGVDSGLAIHWPNRGIPAKYWHRVVEIAPAHLSCLTVADLARTKPTNRRAA